MRTEWMVSGLLLLLALPVRSEAQVILDVGPAGQGQPLAELREVTYRLDLTDRENHQILVTVELSGFERPDIVLELPAWAPRYSVHGFSRNISEIVAEGPDGIALEVTRIGLHRWRVRTGGIGDMAVHYQVYANTPSPFAAQLNAALGYLNPAAVLMYLPDYPDLPVTVRIEAPPSWKAASSLEPTFDPLVFRAGSYRELAVSPLMVSRFRERFTTIREMNVSFLLTSLPGGLDLSAFQRDLELLISRAVEIFGVLPALDHTFLFHFPNAPVRAALGNPTVTVVHWGLQGPGGSPAALLQLTLRAFLEAWLGGTVRPQALVSSSLSEPYVTDSLWFLDGAAEYLAEVLMVRTGLKPSAAFLDRLGSEVTVLQNTPARSSQTVAEASTEVWFREDEWYRSPSRSLDHRNKGFLLALLLDLEMRRASGNTRSIEDLLAFMASYFGRGGSGFDESKDIIRAAGALSRTDLSPFLMRYVEGTDELPYDPLLAVAGWTLRPVAEEVATTGFATDAEGEGALRVTSVEERSPAARAGLQPGDRVVSVNGSFLVGSLREIVSASRPGDILTLRIQRGTREEEISFPLGRGNRQAYVVEPLPDPEPAQLAVARSLLGPAASPADVPPF